MEFVPMSIEDALAVFDEKASGESISEPLEKPEDVFESDEER